MSELTREQVNEEIRTIVGSFDIERFDEVKRCREAIMAHDQAQRDQLLTQAQDNAILARKLVDLEAQCKMLEKERARDAAYDDKQIRALTDQREQDRQRIEELERDKVGAACQIMALVCKAAKERDALKQRLTALEQERRKDAVDGQGALEERDEQIRTLTQALAQARGALKAVLEQWINGRKVKDGMSLTLRLHIESLLDVPAAGGGDVREAAKKYLGELQNNIAATGGYYLYPDKALADLEALIASCKPAAPAPPLVWTTEKPTVPGWYWWRMFEGDSKPRVTGLYQGTDGKLHSLMKGGQWAGPLPLPKEA